MLLQGGLLAAQVASSDSDYGNLYMAGAGLGAQLLMQRYSRERPNWKPTNTASST